MKLCPTCGRRPSEREETVWEYGEAETTECPNDAFHVVLADAGPEAVALLRTSIDVLDRIWAVTWDSHYGKGVTREYAASVDRKVNPLKDRLRALLARLPEGEEGGA